MVDFSTNKTHYLLVIFSILFAIPVLCIIATPFPILESVVIMFLLVVIGSKVVSSNIHFDDDYLTCEKGWLIWKSTITILYCDIDKVNVYYDFIPRIVIAHSTSGKKRKLFFFIRLSQYIELAKLYKLLYCKLIDIMISYPESYLSPIVSQDWDAIVRKQKHLKTIERISSLFLLISISLCLYFCIKAGRYG